MSKGYFSKTSEAEKKEKKGRRNKKSPFQSSTDDRLATKSLSVQTMDMWK